ncbi:MAG: VWA domain-containing protein [Planctomycetes bacterium]|nr:VWA domain-containing protein [Planctomycetota bacterium]
MNGFEFARAEVLPWLLLVPVLAFVCWLLHGRGRAAAGRYGAGRAPNPWPPTLRTSALLLLGGLVWADPRHGDEVVQVERRGLDLIVCLDTSRSMLARDLEPNRLARALQDIRAVLPKLEGGDRVALVVFAGQARLWVPLTHDLDSFRGLLDEVDTDVVKQGGTDLAAALRKAKELVDKDNARTTAVLLLTDGEDLAGAGRQAAGELAALGVRVHAVGYGSKFGSKIAIGEGGKESFLVDRDGREVVSKLDDESLRAIAQPTGGEFLRAEAMMMPLVQLHRERLLPMQKRSYDAGEETGKQARFQWLLLPLVLLLLFEIATAGGRHR